MNRKELERAWPAAEPSPGFAERVLDRLQRSAALHAAPVPSAPVLHRVSGLRWRAARPLSWLALSAVALAIAVGGPFVFESPRPARQGEVIAAEPSVVSIGERAVAELASGAHIRWSGDDLQQAVQQERGEVTYRVEPGGRFEVQTPYGNVAAFGTVFRVVVADPNPAGGEPMKKPWAIAGAGASLVALLFVSVERGSVRLSTAEHALEVVAGQAGSVGLDGIPRRKSLVPQDAESTPDAAQAEVERQRARQVADAVRRHAAKRRELVRAAKPARDPGVASSSAASEPAPPPVLFGPFRKDQPLPELTREQARQRDYIRRTVREQYFPVARDCYAELLERQPAASGRITLEFAIVGDGDAGVVDRVALRDEDDDSIEDPEFRLCMTESMYTAVFEPPPPGASETTVVYPVVLAPE